MAFGSSSAVFKQFVLSPLVEGTTTGATGYTGIDTDTTKVALFNNSVTPDKDAAMANIGYNSGTWTTTNEVTDTLNSNWAAGGRALANDAFSGGTNLVKYSADNLAGGGTLTLAATYGCLVYDDTISGGTVPDEGICFNSFGGAQQVTSGTFTIVWHANGIFQITV